MIFHNSFRRMKKKIARCMLSCQQGTMRCQWPPQQFVWPLTLLLLTSPVDAAEIVIRLPDATLRDLLSQTCRHEWIPQAVIPAFSCADLPASDPRLVPHILDQVIQAFSRDRRTWNATGATVEVTYDEP